MVKLFLSLIILLFLCSCSFDNKTGIWKNENSLTKKSNDLFKDFELISSSNEIFNEIILYNKEYEIFLDPLINNKKWNDIFLYKNNNLNNFKLKNLNQEVFRSKKLTKHNLNNYTLFENNHLINSDEKGNLIIFSITTNEIIKFNFYKDKFKKIKKYLNFYVERNIIYVSDNLGYLYAYDYILKKILWAKNYKIPFRSNLKVSKNDLIAANQNNNLYFFNKKNGEILKNIPTEETPIKNSFVNNLSLSNNSLFFFNTYGSLYSLDLESKEISWFINLNQSLELNPGNLFLGNQIVNNNQKIVVSSSKNTHVIDIATGSIIYTKNFSSIIKPIISKNISFLITRNDLLVAIDLSSGEIIYSYDINEKISKFFKIKKKKVFFKEMMLVNNDILVFLNNSYVLNFEKNGELKDVFTLPSKIYTSPIIIENSILYLTSRNKLSILN